MKCHGGAFLERGRTDILGKNLQGLALPIEQVGDGVSGEDTLGHAGCQRVLPGRPMRSISGSKDDALGADRTEDWAAGRRQGHPAAQLCTV